MIVDDVELSDMLTQIEELAQRKGLRPEPEVLKVPPDTQAEIDAKAEEADVFKADGSRTLTGKVQATELSVDPADPDEGQWVMWMSDGVGTGDDGDIMVKIRAGGSTKTTTLVDFSAI